MTPVTITTRPEPVTLARLLETIADAARAEAVEVHIVGGFVRDRLRGVGERGTKDIDLLSVGGGRGGLDVLGAVATRLGWPRPQLFERFGTGQVRGDGWVVEMVEARAERYDPASRRPEVRTGTLEEDVWRRDFTCNALVQTLDGRVLDVTGRGLDDLRRGILRTPLDPAETFAEDPLRMFRAARFVAELGFSLAPGTAEAMAAVAERASILSVERIRDELRRLLVGADARAGIEVLRRGGLLDGLLPEVAAMRGVEQSGYHCHDVYDHTLAALVEAPPDLVTRTATLLHDVGKPPCHAVDASGRHTFHDHPAVGAAIAEAILSRLRFSNAEIADVAALVRLHLRPIQHDPLTHSDAAVRRLIRDAGHLRSQLLDVARADTLASAYPGVDGIDALERRMAELDAGGALSRPRPALDGAALMARTGRGPGPWIGTVHRALEEAVVEGSIAPGDPEAAWAWLTGARPDLLDRPGG